MYNLWDIYQIGAFVALIGILFNSLRKRTFSEWTSKWSSPLCVALLVGLLLLSEISRIEAFRSKQDTKLVDLELGILNSKIPLQVARVEPDLGGRGYGSRIAASLSSEARIFQTSVRVEDGKFPVDAMTNLVAWKTLEKDLLAYSQQLELMKKQHSELDDYTSKRENWLIVAEVPCIVIILVNGWRKNRIK